MPPISEDHEAPVDLRFVARLRSNGQMTVPNEVRDLADIDDGDLIEFQLLGVKKKSRRPDRDPDPNMAADYGEIDA